MGQNKGFFCDFFFLLDTIGNSRDSGIGLENNPRKESEKSDYNQNFNESKCFIFHRNMRSKENGNQIFYLSESLGQRKLSRTTSPVKLHLL